ncbi:MAG: glycosyltransferase family 39 protein [Patescibacteria group bacterium]
MNKKLEYSLLTIILLIGIFFRFYDLKNTPPGLYPDEAMNGSNALEAIENTRLSTIDAPMFGGKIFYPENNGREGLFINTQALSVHIFGNEPWALRGVSAVFGSLTVLGVYLLAKELFRLAPIMLFRVPISGSLIALFSSFFLATSYWHINFSRIGFRAIMVPLFLSFGFYWLFKAFRTRKITATLCAGIFIGLGFHTYIAFRMVPLILATVLGYKIFIWRKERASETKGCAPCTTIFMLLVIFVISLPIGSYFLNNPADFTGRGGQVSVFSAENPAYEFVRSTALSLGMFNIRGDCNERHNFNCQPELYWPVGIFFIIGLILTLIGLLQKGSGTKEQSLFLCVSFIAMMLPAILTREGLPHALRSIGMLIPVMIMSGVGAAWIWKLADEYLSASARNPEYANRIPQIQRIKKELVILFFLGLAFIAINLLNTYHFRFANSKDAYLGFSANLTNIGRFIKTLPANTPKYVIVNGGGDTVRGIPISGQPIMFLTGTFTEKSRNEKNTHYIIENELSLIPQEKPLFIIPINTTKELIGKIKERFPAISPTIPGDFAVFEAR